MTFTETLKLQQAERAAKWLANCCKHYGVAPADVLKTIGDFDSFWTAWAPKDVAGVIGYWKPAVQDACEALKWRKERADVQKAREEYAHSMGGEVCAKCGGEGGHHSWPGYVCYDCGGKGYVKH